MVDAKETARSLNRSIGTLLRARRKALKLTLQELADRSELSPAFISQVERGKATPSIVSLVNLAKGLETDIHYFITPPPAASLVRRADSPQYLELDSVVRYARLDSDIRNQQMNALLMEVPAGVSLPTVRREVGEDFFYVLEGTVELTIGDQKFELANGDSVHINTQIDHSVVNIGNATARLIWVGTPPILPVA
ncbi:helix-turn-helix domain-containing protein [Lentisalinibacter sediminis]|uniref:helix-turn-helix domain-containing protein n=1 Tax=Lentisalinibacter sediminis TaxID=2992237 RepID=UPI00386A53CE